MKSDTIAAIATAMTSSGIGIVRISGEDSFSIIRKIYRNKEGNLSSCNWKSHTVHYGYIQDGEQVIDEVMILIMAAPNSYTREDTVEIDCHGGVLVMKRILETVLKNGARPAEPGEFTKRAFLNGRIDLTQAEAVIDLIEAKNEYAMESSINQLKGSLKKDIHEIREQLLYEIAWIESALDDPEHITMDGFTEELYGKVKDIRKRIQCLLDTSDNGRMIKEGIRTVIVGKPNVGKSSLLNILAGEDRAIVTDVAGTTRDVLEEMINLNGILLNVMDTAGIRNTSDTVEKIGVEKARNYASKADLILYVMDSSTEADENDKQIMDLIQGKKIIVLLNKSDLPTVLSKSQIMQKLDALVIPVSAKTGVGILKLEETIKDMFFYGKIDWNDEVILTSIRQKNALKEADRSLELVIKSMEDHMSEDFYSIDLMGAYESLGTIIGEAVEDDLIQKIFQDFCMGK